MADIPQFSRPFSFAGTGFKEVEQDSPEDVTQCVETVLETPVGSRVEVPAYGVPDETFEQLGPDLSAEVYLAAIEEWEPRARVLGEAQLEELTKRVTITEAAA